MNATSSPFLSHPCPPRVAAGFLAALFLGPLLALPGLAQGHGDHGDIPSPTEAGQARIVLPPLDLNLQMMEVRRFAQLETLWRFQVFHELTFTDRQVESGITFKHEIVDDAGRFYKAVHYDHGNGLAVADVDGDGLYDLYFLTQRGSNQLWKNLGGGHFADITAEAGVALADRISVTGSFADVDNDGDPDLFVTSVRGGNAFFRNDGKGHFTDATAEAGLSYVGHSSGAVFFDYDRDGHLDLFLTNVGRYTTEEQGAGGYWVGLRDAFSGHLFPERGEASILYRNLGGGRFADVSGQVGLVDTSWSGDATVADLNEDGFPDLYVLNMQGNDHYYENEGGKRFVEKTSELFPKTPWGAMGVKFFDYDNDGLPDLMITDMHSDMSREVTPGFEKVKSLITWSDSDYLQGGADNLFGNAFYHNLGGGRFEEVSDRIGAENYWPWGFSTGDLNADGFADVFIASSMNFPYRYGVNTLLLNNGGREFLDSEFILGIEPRAKGPLRPWFEVDCSGVDRARQICQGLAGKQWVWGAAGTRSSAIFDLEGDGDLDIVTNEFGDHPQVLVSDLTDRRPISWLGVRLVGTTSNRDGLGARVRVWAGGKVYTQWHDGKSGYLTQSALPLYFGLGDSSGVEKVEVLWPSGKTQTVSEGLAPGRIQEIREPR